MAETTWLNDIGAALFAYTRMLRGADIVKPDVRVFGSLQRHGLDWTVPDLVDTLLTASLEGRRHLPLQPLPATTAPVLGVPEVRVHLGRLRFVSSLRSGAGQPRVCVVDLFSGRFRVLLGSLE